MKKIFRKEIFRKEIFRKEIFMKKIFRKEIFMKKIFMKKIFTKETLVTVLFVLVLILQGCKESISSSTNVVKNDTTKKDTTKQDTTKKDTTKKDSIKVSGDSVVIGQYSHGVFEIPAAINNNPLDVGNHFMGSWVGNKIIMTTWVRQIEIDMRGKNPRDIGFKDSLVIRNDGELAGVYPEHDGVASTFIRMNTQGTKLLFIRSKEISISVGALWEYDLNTKQYTKLLDSTHSVSSAAYAPNNDSLIVFYSYGLNQEYGTKAGYYYYNRYTKEVRLIVKHASYFEFTTSETADREQINGFDISPDGRKLLIPIEVQYIGNQPKIVEYDISSGKSDTLKLLDNFDGVDYRYYLWLRYSPSGNDILYCFYPPHCLGSGLVREDSELGIIDRRTYQREVLDKPNLGVTLAVWPTWSSDGHHICFGVTTVGWHLGYAGDYELWIKMNVR